MFVCLFLVLVFLVFFNFKFDLDRVDEQPPRGCATANFHFLFVCLFVCFLSIELVTYTERFATWPFPSPFFIGRDFEWPSVKSN